jgi:hypothetical protein
VVDRLCPEPEELVIIGASPDVLATLKVFEKFVVFPPCELEGH